MSELHAKVPRYIFQDITAECPRCRNTDVAVVSLDTEPGLRWSRHFVDRHPRGLITFCDGSLAEYERAKPDRKPKKTGTHGR